MRAGDRLQAAVARLLKYGHMRTPTPILTALYPLATRQPAVWSWVLLFVCLLAFVPAGHMQTRMAIGQLYAAADICLASQHGVAQKQERSGVRDEHTNPGSSAHHCAACLPALDHGVTVIVPAYASWAQRLSQQPRQLDIPRQALAVLPRPPGQAPPFSLV